MRTGGPGEGGRVLAIALGSLAEPRAPRVAKKSRPEIRSERACREREQTRGFVRTFAFQRLGVRVQPRRAGRAQARELDVVQTERIRELARATPKRRTRDLVRGERRKRALKIR